MNTPNSPKLALNSIFTARVRDLSSEGAGVLSHPEGPIFFVEGTWPGDLVEAQIESLKGRYGYARVVKLLERSPERVDALPCAHSGWGDGQCGGCPWMIADYSAQTKRKHARVEYALKRASLLGKPDLLKDIWPSPPLGYRNRAQFKTDGAQLGFVSRAQHTIAPVEDCQVLNAEMRAHLQALRAQLPRGEWQPDRDLGYTWNFIERDDTQPADAPVQLNSRRPFRQGNSVQNERMRAWVRAKLKEQGDVSKAQALELFCGSGNFTELLSEAGYAQILAVEVARPALRDLDDKKWRGVRTRALDLSQRGNYLRLADEVPHASLMLLDPPREGADGVARLADELPDLRTLLYVSCDLATFVRDAGALQRKGFTLTELQPLDMFPQTPHVELLSVFKKQ